MWELRSESGPRTFTYKSGTINRCPVCGQHFISGEEYFLIVCNAIPEARARKLSNFMAHVACWNTFCSGITSDEDLAEKLRKHRKPKLKPLTEEQETRVEAFKQAAYTFGYRILTWTREGCLKARKDGYSSTLTYNPYDKSLSYGDNRADFLLKSLVDRELVARVYNKMHELLGDGKRDDYTALGTINQVIEETNRFFNN